MTQRLGPLSNRTRSRVAMLMMLILSGCGYADYDMRLNETKKYWTYLDTIERLLAGKWTAPSAMGRGADTCWSTTMCLILS